MVLEKYLLSTEEFRTIEDDLSKVLVMANSLNYVPKDLNNASLVHRVKEEPYKTVPAILLSNAHFRDALLIKQKEMEIGETGYVLYRISKDNNRQ